jgi:hypothetical protein
MEALLQIFLVIGLVLSAIVAGLGVYFWARQKTFNIYTVNKGDAPGIPFFVKKGRFMQSTFYLETFLGLTLAVNVKRTGFLRYGVQKIVRWPRYKKEVTAFESALDSDWKDAKAKLERIPCYLEEDLESPILESNVFEQQSYVDYEATHYINVQQPRSGTAQLTIELAPDGTLSKTTGEIADTTLEQITGLLPSAEELLSPKPAAEGLVEDQGNFEISYSKSYLARRHALSRKIELADFNNRSPIKWEDREKEGVAWRQEWVKQQAPS